MDLPVLIEPLGAGRFRARTGEPLSLLAEADTADAALADVRRQWLDRQTAGARLEILAPVNPLSQVGGMFKDDPDFDAWVEVIKEYRATEDARYAAEDALSAAAG